MVFGTWRAYIASLSVRQAVVFGIVILAVRPECFGDYLQVF
ncbi:hypothetical protein [Selenomonas noxia]|nr:hypothetical protein [Selenomonas noxia]